MNKANKGNFAFNYTAGPLVAVHPPATGGGVAKRNPWKLFFLLSSVCPEYTGVLLLISSRLAVSIIIFTFLFLVCCVVCTEMWFIYLLSWLSLVIQISFVTLAIGRCFFSTLANTRRCLLAASRCCLQDLRGQASVSNSVTVFTNIPIKLKKNPKHIEVQLLKPVTCFFAQLLITNYFVYWLDMYCKYTFLDYKCEYKWVLMPRRAATTTLLWPGLNNNNNQNKPWC